MVVKDRLPGEGNDHRFRRSGEKKPPDNLAGLGSPLINALKRITSHVINYAALGLIPYYPPQTASSTFHRHNLMGTLNSE